MSLTIHFNATTLTLAPAPPAPSPTALTFHPHELVHKGAGTELYRGRLRRASCTDTRDVVCKLAHATAAIARVAHEAGAYAGALAALQGAVVPVCYGHFVGEDAGGRSVGCLVLAYCGEPLQVPFAKVDRQVCTALALAATRLHDAGIKHHDLVPKHVLTGAGGTAILIDFARAEAHICRRAQPLVAGRREPRPAEFRCSELFRLGRELMLWRSVASVLKCSSRLKAVPPSKSSRALAAGVRRHVADSGVEDEDFKVLEDRLLTGFHL